MSTLPDPPADIDLSETKVPELVSVFVVTWVLGVLCVGLRVFVRLVVRRNKLWWDDWLVMASLIWSGAFMFDVTCYMVPQGLGKHIWVAPADALKSYFLGLFIAEWTYTLSLVLVKCSILAFYWRIFSAEPKTRLFIYIMAGMVLSWGIAVILVTIFQCLPVNAFWMRYDLVNPMQASEYTCGVGVKEFFIGNAIPNILTDFLMILVPLPSIYRLYLPRSQKYAIMGIFVVGLFVTAVSIVRLQYVLALDLTAIDATWNWSDEMMWTGVETNVATICACLPNLKPLFNLIMFGSWNHSTVRSTNPDGTSRNGPAISLPDRKWPSSLRLNPQEHGSSKAFVTAQGKDDKRPFSVLTDNESNTWREQDSDLELMGGSLRQGGASGVVVTTQVNIHNSK
ncbi:hypothetical protein JX265_000190 [Neoarthrinium moseri]|uniref:Rhodopsin domain-containing protein n=1 Tax=Neoarthrinium moseri TaxID=1658444 RepID=A0A9P9WXY5_9PEZI|nr:hypothetical protein JX266_002017 [Neoarthrinium moseri]KAI1881364.1 hypothetical protein JX265_000190 [Neoarthrinium moseri]